MGKLRLMVGALLGLLVACSEDAAPAEVGATFSQDPAGVFINELHYDNEGTDAGEAVEVAGPAGTDLTGWSVVLYNGNGGSSYDRDLLEGTIPDQGGGFGTVSLSYPVNGVQNGAPDGLALVDPEGVVVQFLSYEGAFTAADGPAQGCQSTDIGVAESGGTPVGFSLQLTGTGATYADFTWSGPSDDSFGAPNAGQTFTGDGGAPGSEPCADDGGEAEDRAIYEIQGAAHVSPLDGDLVRTTGVVTAVDSNGFYLQDPEGDGNLATSDAVFVFTSSAPSVSVGDEVRVTGTVSEFTPGGAESGNLSVTQLSDPTVAGHSAGNDLPAPTVVGEGGRTPPVQVIDDDGSTKYRVEEGAYEPTEDGVDFFESLEGMRVTVSGPRAVSPTNRFGEIFTVTDGGADATGLSARGTLNISPDDFNPERVQVQTDGDLLPGFAVPQVDVGARLEDVTGVVSYSFGNFEVLATEPFGVAAPSSLPREVTGLAPTEGGLTVSNYNVLNLDPNDADGDADVANGQFGAIAEQIVTNLRAPDIIALQEIQDNDGSVNSSVTAADETLRLLAEAVRAAGGPPYAFLDNPFIGDDTNGGQPGGNIRVAFLYNPARVSFQEGSLRTVTDPEAQRTDERNPFFDARLPLAATFTFNGQEVTVVNNHFSSKGGSSPLFGRVQPAADLQEDPAVNGSVDERRAQAEAVKAFVDGLLGNDPEAKVVVLGDLNEFEFVSPLEILEGSLVNLTETLPENERYSYIFEGNSQSLDHLLVSEALAEAAQFDAVHVNAEFAEAASDHDPLVARLELPAPSPEEALAALQEAVRALYEDGTLNRGQAAALLTPLNVAERHLERGQERLAAASLVRFERRVAFFVQRGELTPEQGEPLIEASEGIRDRL